MRHSADDFAALSGQHRKAANRSASSEQHSMHLEIAHHYAEIAAIKGGRSLRG
jgi:hypothetical protein